MVWRPAEALSVSGNVGRAWRAPTLFELFSNGPHLGEARYEQGDPGLRPEAGTDGHDRITLIWPDDQIKNTWLQITVLANQFTGLVSPHVFYFGNLVGETGERPLSWRVTVADLMAVRRNYSNDLANSSSRYDFNHDRKVDARDAAVVRTNLFHTLRRISTPPAPAGASAAPAPASPFFSAPAANLSGSGSSATRRVWDEPPAPLV